MSERPAQLIPEEAPHVLLLRSPDAEGEDRYVQALAERGFRAVCRPVLRFAFAGAPGFNPEGRAGRAVLSEYPSLRGVGSRVDYRDVDSGASLGDVIRSNVGPRIRHSRTVSVLVERHTVVRHGIVGEDPRLRALRRLVIGDIH